MGARRKDSAHRRAGAGDCIGAGTLGGDEESVCAALTLAASELSRLEEELRQRERETGRITAALCLGGGAMLCILLL